MQQQKILRAINWTSICSILLLGSGFMLAGCSTDSKGGLNILARSSPDEYAVVSRKPLTLPPDFSLRPPADIQRASLVAITDTTKGAKNILLGKDTDPPAAEKTNTLDQDDKTFLKFAGTDKAQPNIRVLVDQESTDLLRANKNFVRELLSDFLEKEPPGKVLNPSDAERAVRQSILLSSTPGVGSKATIMRAEDTKSSLWPF